jgi:hypothetical protein
MLQIEGSMMDTNRAYNDLATYCPPPMEIAVTQSPFIPRPVYQPWQYLPVGTPARPTPPVLPEPVRPSWLKRLFDPSAQSHYEAMKRTRTIAQETMVANRYLAATVVDAAGVRLEATRRLAGLGRQYADVPAAGQILGEHLQCLDSGVGYQLQNGINQAVSTLKANR